MKMNDVTNTPVNVEDLFHFDIVSLYNEANKVLESELTSYQECGIAMYTNGVIEMHKDLVFPEFGVTDSDEVYDLLSEMWQRTSQLVEDIPFRRAFILICRAIVRIGAWPREKDVTYNDIVAWCEKY